MFYTIARQKIKSMGGSSKEIAGVQPLSNTFVFLSVALQQKNASEIYFYINFFKQKFSSFDKPIKRFAFIIPKKQFLYRVLNHG